MAYWSRFRLASTGGFYREQPTLEVLRLLAEDDAGQVPVAFIVCIERCPAVAMAAIGEAPLPSKTEGRSLESCRPSHFGDS